MLDEMCAYTLSEEDQSLELLKQECRRLELNICTAFSVQSYSVDKEFPPASREALKQSARGIGCEF